MDWKQCRDPVEPGSRSGRVDSTPARWSLRRDHVRRDHRPVACFPDQDVLGKRHSALQPGTPRPPGVWHHSGVYRRRRHRPRILHYQGRRCPPDRLASDGVFPRHGESVRADQLRHRGPRGAGENVGEPRGRPNVGRDHQRGPALCWQHRARDGHRIPHPDPGAVAPPRGTPPMRLRGIRSFGPTLWGIALFLVVLAGTAPWIPVFLLTVLIQLLIFSTLAYSLNLITGLTGYVSFGHVVFMAFGAYALAFAVGTFHLHPVAGVALGGLLGPAPPPGLGGVPLPFRGAYLALSTPGLAVPP